MNTITNLNDLLRMAFNAIGIALAISVIVLNILGAATLETQVILLAIGLFGIALGRLSEESK